MSMHLLNLQVSKTSWLCLSKNMQTPYATWTQCCCSRSVCWTWQLYAGGAQSSAHRPSPCTRSRRVRWWTRSASWARTGGRCPLLPISSLPALHTLVSTLEASPPTAGHVQLAKVSRSLWVISVLNFALWTKTGGSVALILNILDYKEIVLLSECAPNVKSALFSTPTLLPGVLCALRVSRWVEMGPGLLVHRLTLCLLFLGQASRAARVAHESCTTSSSLSASCQRADQIREAEPVLGCEAR